MSVMVSFLRVECEIPCQESKYRIITAFYIPEESIRTINNPITKIHLKALKTEHKILSKAN